MRHLQVVRDRRLDLVKFNLFRKKYIRMKKPDQNQRGNSQKLI